MANKKRMLIDALHPEETRVVIADERQVYDFDFVSSNKKPLKGNIYLAKVTRVEPSLQAAFVEYGGGKQGFLPFSEIHADYYQIPVSDRQRLVEEDASEEETEDNNANAKDEKTEQAPEENKDKEQTDSEEVNETSANVPLAPAIEETPDSEEADDDKPISMKEAAEDVSTSEEVAPPPAEEADTKDAQAKTDSAPNGENASEDVETIETEEEEIQSRPKNRYSRRYKIQEVIRRGQVVLVQVIKEERGNKGASLTSYLSLAGRYCVLMPNSPKDGGISRKIASAEDRKRLKAISTELRLAQGMSVIIRTAGMDRTRAEIKRDYDYLVKLWNHIREETLKSNAPALIYEESDVVKRAIRDQYTNDIDEVVIEGDEGYKAAKEFMQLLLPSHTPKIKQYKESTPLFYAYDIEDQLLSMHDESVKLKSGGYIVINPTEALISIDVNSGRATSERNIEETAAKTNLEAAAEVARQLKLRDLAGLIVIDFIDMLDSRNRRAVERALKDALKMDRAKIQLGRISPFGLLEMSRQRLRPSISETNMVQCPHCIGRGYIRSNESMSIQMIRALEKEAATGNWSGLRLIAPQAVALHLLNTKRSNLDSIEERHDVTIQVLISPDLATSDYNLEKMRRSNADQKRGRGKGRKAADSPVKASKVLEEMDIPSEDEATQEEDGRTKRRSRRGRRGGRNRGDKRNSKKVEEQENTTSETTADEKSPADEENPSTSADTEKKERRPRRSRTRGGTRRRRKEAEDKPSTEKEASPTNDNDAKKDDGKALPAFATNEPVPIEPPAPAYEMQKEKKAVNAPESTPRDPNVPAKKGWWQKMIELDD
ncbi:MAG: Rne/Rng family ribonuclease [Rickettsiales bacterium]